MNIGAGDLEALRPVEIRRGDALRRRRFRGVSTDSRSVAAGDLFIALRGERFDGHAFLRQAAQRGALAAIIDREHAGRGDPGCPLVVVDDTLRALGDLAALYRRKFTLPVLGIGGSNGKTTTKDMVAAVLRAKYRVLSTEGNLNNHIGVPHTLFGLRPTHEVAVVELGTNHPGEIEALCGIAAPTHALLTNIGREHLEFFGDLDGVAREEGALLEWVRKRRGGVAFVNVDDERAATLARGVPKVVRFGLGRRRTDVRGRVLGLDQGGCARLEIAGGAMRRPARLQLHVPGRHHAANAVAAAAVGLAFRVPVRGIVAALESFRAASRRMELVHVGGVTILNDAYNANPESTAEALRTLAALPARGKRIAVLADMRELGPAAPAEHRRVGEIAAELGIDYLLTHGELARSIAAGAGGTTAIHYEQKNVLAEYLAELVAPGDAVLVKGSRMMRMEDVAVFLTERLRSAGRS